MERPKLLEIKSINIEIIEYYKLNINHAKEDYENLIILAKPRGLDKSSVSYYTEIHHIIPKSLGGSDSEENLVMLSYQEHVLAHMLLYIIYDKVETMIAFRSMLNISKIKFKENQFNIDIELLDNLREEFSKNFSKNNPMKNPDVAKKQHENISAEKWEKIKQGVSKYMKENNPMKNSETIEKMRKSKLGKSPSLETRKMYSRIQKGKKRSIEALEKAKEIRNSFIVSPDSTRYNTLTEAAMNTGYSRSSIRRWISSVPEKGWKLEPKQK